MQAHISSQIALINNLPQRHVMQAVTRNEKPTITMAMKKLSKAPKWACVPLPETMDRASTLTYLQDINSKKMIANKKLKATIDETCTKHKSNTFRKLVTLHCTDTKRFWQFVNGQHRKRKGISAAIATINSTRTLVRSPTEIMKTFYQYWASLYAPNPTVHTDTPWLAHTKPICSNADLLTAPISEEEYQHALQNLRQGAPGTDGLDAAILRALPNAAHNILREAMSNIVNKGEALPDEWRQARMTLIPKDGSPHDPANYRPISLLQVSYKLFTSIITN